ncbi:MAG: hypothetical protein AB1898_18720 [Acidobacteriota bacterium]
MLQAVDCNHRAGYVSVLANIVRIDIYINALNMTSGFSSKSSPEKIAYLTSSPEILSL